MLLKGIISFILIGYILFELVSILKKEGFHGGGGHGGHGRHRGISYGGGGSGSGGWYPWYDSGVWIDYGFPPYGWGWNWPFVEYVEPDCKLAGCPRGAHCISPMSGIPGYSRKPFCAFLDN